jgi:NTP pyrophosphatase (non-canonical NTP hydrolase)
MNNLVKRTLEVASKFPDKYDKRDRVLDLMEEVGELVQAFMVVDGRKKTFDPKKQYTMDDLEDAVCDVLYALIMISNQHGIDIDKSYKEMLFRLEKRVESGEFNKNNILEQ